MAHSAVPWSSASHCDPVDHRLSRCATSLANDAGEADDGDFPAFVVAPPPVAVDTPESREARAKAVAEFVDQIKQLPLFTNAAMQLMQSIDQEDLAVDELSRLISGDVGLVAQLLRIVNSPFYGLPQRCSTVAAAVSVLGFTTVRRAVMATVTHRPLMAYLHDTQVVHDFWRHLMLCAALARHLAAQKGLDGEAAYMAGLMHEIGRLAILIEHPHLTDALLGAERDDDHLDARRERSRFGFDHAEVGGALLARWAMPEAIVEAVEAHEQTSEPSDPFCAAVWRANLLAHEMVDEPEDIPEPLPWMTAIKLSLEDRRRIFEEIAAFGGQR